VTTLITNNAMRALPLSDRIADDWGPAATMGPSVSVAIPKPRTTAQLQHDMKRSASARTRSYA
jgi:hypothetical protein